MKLFPRNFELKFEITERCGSRCTFCHQDYGGRGSAASLDHVQVEERIRWAAAQGIAAVRFTGGEPLLHPQLVSMARTAHDHDMFVTVNTNGLSREGRYDELRPVVDMFKVSLPASDSSTVDRLTRVEGAFDRKISAIGHCLSLGVEVQILTVIVPENLGTLARFVEMCAGVPNLTWVPLRAEMTPGAERPVLGEHMQAVAMELSSLMDEYPGMVPKLGLATPFCAVDPPELGERVFMGRGEDCGPFCSLTVTPQNRIISCYSCRTPIGSLDDFANLQEDAEYLRLAGIARLPARCRSCQYVDRCMGGCSAAEATVQDQDGERDYLAAP